MKKSVLNRIAGIILVAAALSGCGKKSDVIDFSGKEGISPPVRHTGEDGEEQLYEIDPGLLKQDLSVVFVNTCGQDIEKLNVSFSAGGAAGGDILAGKRLKDGSTHVYEDPSLVSLAKESALKMSVKAETKKDGELDFGSIGILDLSDTRIVLDRNEDSWVMYLE